MSIFGKIFDVVGDFGSNAYNAAKGAVSGLGSAVGNVFGSGVADTTLQGVSLFTPGTGVLNRLGQIGQAASAVGAIGNLVSDKDSGQGSPLGAFTGLQGAPNPVATTSGLGTGSSANLLQFGTAPNASGQSFFPNAPLENQSGLIETNQSSLGSLVPFGTGLAGQAFQIAKPFLSSKASQAVGLLGGLATTLIGDDDNNKKMPDLVTDYDISKFTGDFMAYGVGGQVAVQQPMQMGSAFMSPVLGRIGISSKGNIIITRRLKNQFKALADNVGLAQASNLAGVPLEIGAMILTKRFATRGKSISTKKMQECARTYKRITNFYNMIPRRTATRTTRARTTRGASTVIQNS